MMEFERAEKLADLVNKQKELTAVIQAIESGEEKYPYITIEVAGYGFSIQDKKVKIPNRETSGTRKSLLNALHGRNIELVRSIETFKVHEDEVH